MRPEENALDELRAEIAEISDTYTLDLIKLKIELLEDQFRNERNG